MVRSATLPGEWAERGACREPANPDLWYAVDTTRERDQPGKYRTARRICSTCEVRAQCLEFAILNNECCGMWGGFLPFERRKIRRKGRITFTPDGKRGFTISTTDG